MVGARVLWVVLTAVSFDPCNGGTADGGTTAVSTVDAAGAPVLDDVTLADTATIDLSTGVAHVVGAISFHSDDSTVTAVNVLAHGTSGTVYRGSVAGGSPQPLVLDLRTPGAFAYDINVVDAKNRVSALVTKTIVVRE